MEAKSRSLMEINNSKEMQAMLDQLPYGIVFLNPNLVVLNANSFFLSRKLQNIDFYPFMPLEDLLDENPEQTLQAFRQAIQQGQSITLSSRMHGAVFKLAPPGEFPTLTKTAQTVLIIPIKDFDQSINGVMAVMQDVSDRVWAETNLEKEVNKLTFLHEFDLALSTLDINTCMQTLVTRLQDLFDVDLACLLVAEGDGLHVVTSAGLPISQNSLTVDPQNSITGWVWQNSKPLWVKDVSRDARYVPAFDSIVAEMAVPLIAGGHCIGVIDLECSNGSALTQDDLQLLELVAFSAANALHNAQIHSEVNYWRTYYQGLINQTADVVYTVDRELRLTSVNTAWNHFAVENDGQSVLSPQCIGKYLLAGFTGDSLRKWQIICNELLSGSRNEYNEDITCHSPQKERWLSLRAVPLHEDNGKISGIIFSTHDISYHIQSQRKLKQVNRQLEILLRVSQQLNQNISNRNIPQTTVDILAEMLQADCVTITQFDTLDQSFRVMAAMGASANHIDAFHSPIEQADKIIEEYGFTGVIYDLTKIESINKPIYEQDNLHGLLYTLIYHEGKITGSLNIFTRDRTRRFTLDEMELVRALTPQIGLAIDHARLYHELLNLATTDSLTGLSNRRQLDDVLAQEIERSKRYQHQFCVLMIDLDYFKSYNDVFGHALGDELLKKLARQIRSLLRVSDIAARYGGDELSIILPETCIPGAICIAQRLQQAASTITLSGIDDSVWRTLTLSIGISTYPSHAQTSAELLRCADQALYKAKQLGRNRIELFKPISI